MVSPRVLGEGSAARRRGPGQHSISLRTCDSPAPKRLGYRKKHGSGVTGRPRGTIAPLRQPRGDLRVDRISYYACGSSWVLRVDPRRRRAFSWATQGWDPEIKVLHEPAAPESQPYPPDWGAAQDAVLRRPARYQPQSQAVSDTIADTSSPRQPAETPAPALGTAPARAKPNLAGPDIPTYFRPDLEFGVTILRVQ
jgi:hypothetical protein